MVRKIFRLFKKKEKYISLQHSNTHLGLYSSKYNGEHPSYIKVDQMCTELNKII